MQDESFPRSSRLIRPADFKRVFSRPMVSSDRYFKVLARAGSGSVARLGLAVSRQVDRRASARNRIKRIARESFRSHFGPQAPLLDIVVLPRREAAGAPNNGLFGSLHKHWERLASRAAKTADESESDTVDR